MRTPSLLAAILGLLLAGCGDDSPTAPSSASWKEDPRDVCPVEVEVLNPRRGQPTTELVECGRYRN